MCVKINTSKAEPGEAYFRKGNEPNGMAYKFKGRIAPCQCGKKLFFLPSVWGMTAVEVVREDESDPVKLKYDQEGGLGRDETRSNRILYVK
jgi:hypothetical protein